MPDFGNVSVLAHKRKRDEAQAKQPTYVNFATHYFREPSEFYRRIIAQEMEYEAMLYFTRARLAACIPGWASEKEIYEQEWLTRYRILCWEQKSPYLGRAIERAWNKSEILAMHYGHGEESNKWRAALIIQRAWKIHHKS